MAIFGEGSPVAFCLAMITVFGELKYLYSYIIYVKIYHAMETFEWNNIVMLVSCLEKNIRASL